MQHQASHVAHAALSSGSPSTHTQLLLSGLSNVVSAQLASPSSLPQRATPANSTQKEGGRAQSNGLQPSSWYPRRVATTQRVVWSPHQRPHQLR